MARRARMNKYSRRTARGRKMPRGLIVSIAVVAFLLLCFAISIPLGIALGRRADEVDEIPRLELGFDDYYSGDKTVRAVDARAYQLGFGVSPYVSIGVDELSLCLRDADGFIAYNSQITVSFGEEIRKGSRDLSAEVSSIHKGGAYLCAYVYVDSFNIEDEYLRGIHKAYEIAIINEAARAGVDEIMLVGLEPDAENIDEMLRFISDAAYAAEKSPLGVLLSREMLEGLAENDHTAARIRSVCDFVALDMRDLDENADRGGEESLLYKTLSEMEHYIGSYKLRVVFSEKNEALRDAAVKFGVESVQIIE